MNELITGILAGIGGGTVITLLVCLLIKLITNISDHRQWKEDMLQSIDRRLDIILHNTGGKTE